MSELEIDFTRVDSLEAKSKKVTRNFYQLLPLVIILSWWVLGFISFAVGWPIEYPKTNFVGVTALFLSTFVLVLFAFSYSQTFKLRNLDKTITTQNTAIVLIKFATILSLVSVVPFIEIYSGYHTWDFFEAVVNQGKAFYLATERINEGSKSRTFFLIFQVIIAPLVMATIPFITIQWLKKRVTPYWVLLALLPGFLKSIYTGRDFPFISSMFVFIATLLIVTAIFGIKSKEFVKSIVTLAALLFIGIIFFILRKTSRYDVDQIPHLNELEKKHASEAISQNQSLSPPGSVDSVVQSVNLNPGPSTAPSSESVEIVQNGLSSFTHFTDQLSQWINSNLITIGSYVSQSFEGLSRALEGTWRFGGGFSHAPSINQFVSGITNPNGVKVITDQLVNFGWSDTANWSTGLSWLANDIPWIVVPLVIALQALLLGYAWKQSVETQDWLFMTIFAYSFLSLFFMFQNLQITLNGPIYVGYISLLVFAFVRLLFGTYIATGKQNLKLHKFIKTK